MELPFESIALEIVQTAISKECLIIKEETMGDGYKTPSYRIKTLTFLPTHKSVNRGGKWFTISIGQGFDKDEKRIDDFLVIWNDKNEHLMFDGKDFDLSPNQLISRTMFPEPQLIIGPMR